MTKENLILNETSLVEAEERFSNLKRAWKEKAWHTEEDVVLNSRTGAYELKGANGTETEHAIDNQTLYRTVESENDTSESFYPVINELNGSLYVSSRDVAKGLGKRHDNIMRDLDKIVESDSSNLSSEIIPSTYTNSRGKEYREYLLTKDGFILYMFNIQGHNDFKMAYINRFNEMEKALHEVANIANTKANLLLSIYNGGQEGVEASKQLVELEKQPLIATIAEQAPKVESYDTFIDRNHTYCFRDLYKEIISATGLKMKENYFKEILRSKKIIVNTSVRATVEAIRKGYAETKDVQCSNSNKTTTQDRFTIKCRDYLINYFNDVIHEYKKASDSLLKEAEQLQCDVYDMLDAIKEDDSYFDRTSEYLLSDFDGSYEAMSELMNKANDCEESIVFYQSKIENVKNELGEILKSIAAASSAYHEDKVDYRPVAVTTLSDIKYILEEFVRVAIDEAEGYAVENVVKENLNNYIN